MTQLNYARALYYRNSGKTPIVRLVAALATILPAVAVAGTAYAFIAAYLYLLSFAKLVLIAAGALMFGFAFAVGALTGAMLKWARVRNLAMVWAVAVLAAVLAWYVSWVVWEWHVLSRMGLSLSIFRLGSHPHGVWLLARLINQGGTFTFGSVDDPVKGPVLWILWGIEASVVLGVASIVPYRMVRGLAFCETCEKWGRTRQGILSVGPASDEDRFRARLELKDMSALEELGPADMGAPRRYRIDLQNCASCDGMHLLSVKRIEVTYQKGQRQEKEKTVVDRLWLEPAEVQAVMAVKERMYQSDPNLVPPGAATAAPAAEAESGAAEEVEDEAAEDADHTDPSTPGTSRRADGGVGL